MNFCCSIAIDYICQAVIIEVPRALEPLHLPARIKTGSAWQLVGARTQGPFAFWRQVRSARSQPISPWGSRWRTPSTDSERLASPDPNHVHAHESGHRAKRPAVPHPDATPTPTVCVVRKQGRAQGWRQGTLPSRNASSCGTWGPDGPGVGGWAYHPLGNLCPKTSEQEGFQTNEPCF